MQVARVLRRTTASARWDGADAESRLGMEVPRTNATDWGTFGEESKARREDLKPDIN